MVSLGFRAAVDARYGPALAEPPPAPTRLVGEWRPWQRPAGP